MGNVRDSHPGVDSAHITGHDEGILLLESLNILESSACGNHCRAYC